jgi:uncharacterized protein
MHSKIGALLIIMLSMLFSSNALLHASTKITAKTNQTKTVIASIEQTEKLALKGDAQAQNLMGKYYFFKKGNGTTEFKNMKKAEHWFRLAAAQGNAESMFGLASILERKAETVEDEIEIARLFEGAARKGNKTAQYSLALYILNGNANLKRDTKFATDLLIKAAAQNYPNAHMALIGMAQKKECDMEVGKKSLRWVEEHAKRGIPDAQFEMGRINEYGYIVPQNFKEARKWYTKSAIKMFGPAFIKLAHFYESGSGVTKDYKRARELYEDAVKIGEFQANWNLGQFHEKGMGVLKNETKAAEYYLKAAKLGHSKSMSSFGIMLLEGRGVAQDIGLAAQWLGQAARWGNAEAQFRFGKMYRKGLIDVELESRDKVKTWLRIIRGVYIDPKIKAQDREGNKWIRKAAAQGHEQAQKVLKADTNWMGWSFLIIGIIFLPISIGLFAWPEVAEKYNPILIRYVSAPLVFIMCIFLLIEGFRAVLM